MVSSKTNPDLEDSDTRLQLLCFETWRWSNCSQSFQGSMTNKPWFNSPHSVSYPCQQVLHVMYHSSCRTYIILLIRVKGNTCGIFFHHLNSSERILSFFQIKGKKPEYVVHVYIITVTTVCILLSQKYSVWTEECKNCGEATRWGFVLTYSDWSLWLQLCQTVIVCNYRLSWTDFLCALHHVTKITLDFCTTFDIL